MKILWTRSVGAHNIHAVGQAFIVIIPNFKGSYQVYKNKLTGSTGMYSELEILNVVKEAHQLLEEMEKNAER